MKAVRLTSPKTFEFVEVETPTPADGQCLIKVERVSVCGSDIRSTYGEIHPEEEYPMAPGRPCHEVAGVVVESRSDAFKVGQRAIVIPGAGQGGLGEYLTSGPERMALLPEHGSLDEWVMCQPSGTVLFSCQQMPNLLGKTVVVLGQGSIGLSFTMITSRMGARHVIGADLLDYRLEKSLEFGATHTVNASQNDPVARIKEMTGGQGVHYAFEAIGLVEAPFVQSLLCTRSRGVTVWVGHAPLNTKVTIDAQDLIMEKTLIASMYGSARPQIDFPRLLTLYKAGKLKLDELVSRRFPLEEVNTAFEVLSRGEVARSVLTFD